MVNGFINFLFSDVLDHLVDGQSERLPCSRNLFTEAFREYRSTERVALKNCQSFFSVQLGLITRRSSPSSPTPSMPTNPRTWASRGPFG